MGALWSRRCFIEVRIMNSIFSVTEPALSVAEGCLRGEVRVRHSDAIESPFHSQYAAARWDGSQDSRRYQNSR